MGLFATIKDSDLEKRDYLVILKKGLEVVYEQIKDEPKVKMGNLE